jgi:ribonuclease BN (tRNA processing enzyme)
MAEVLFVGTGDAFCSAAAQQRHPGARRRQDAPARLRTHHPRGAAEGAGVDPLEIDAVALSHFHGDHIAGLPFLLLDYVYAHPRNRPLEVLGPPGVEERLPR